MRWDENKLAGILEDLRRDFAARDTKAAVRRALLYRRDELSDKTGTFVPPPFDKSKLIIKSMTGTLAYMSQVMAHKGSANPPKPQVNIIIEDGRVVSDRIRKQSASQERALAGMWYAAGGEGLQRRLAWSQVTQGAGWLICSEREASWGLPDREYYDDLPDDEIAKMRAAGHVHEDKGRMVESKGVWDRRKSEKGKERAKSGAGLFALEAVGSDVAYWDEDSVGTKLFAAIEAIPSRHFGPGTELAKRTGSEEYGLIKSPSGAIIGGIAPGAAEEQSGASESWTLARIYSRDEIYYYVSGKGGPFSGGKIVYATEHDYGEVPCWPAPFTITDSVRPEERYIGGLEAAFAYAPVLNALVTLLTNVAAWNATPRYAVMVNGKNGELLLDHETNEPWIVKNEPAIGLDPQQTSAIQGELRPLTIQDDGLMGKLVEFYVARMADVLPSEAARGAGGSSGPAWTTRMLQQAQSQFIAPMVNGHAWAVEQFFRLASRTIRRRGERVYMLAAPGHRGSERTIRAMIELDPDVISDNISVRQDPNTVEERVTQQQIGMELREKGYIDDWTFYEEYMGEDDPAASIFAAHKQRVLDHVMGGQPAPPGSVIEMVASAVRGMLPAALADIAPNVAAAVTNSINAPPPIPGNAGMGQAAGMGFGGNVSEAAGLRMAGMGAAVAQPPLHPLPNPGPLNGAAPMQ